MHGPTSLSQPIRYTIICASRLVEGRWTLGGEDSGTGSLGDAVWKWELEVLGEELLDVWALDVLGLLELDDLENLCYVLERVLMRFGNWVSYVDGTEAGAVASSHVLVESLDSVGAGHLTVLLVHVVGSGTGIVTDPDTEVLDLQWALLMDLRSRN